MKIIQSSHIPNTQFSLFFKKVYSHFRTCSLIFREIRRERERERVRDTWMWERHIDLLPPAHALAPTRDWTHNLDMCPDQESNQWLLVYGMILQTTEPYQPGPLFPIINICYKHGTFINEPVVTDTLLLIKALLYQISIVFTYCLLFVPASPPGYHITFSHHVSLSSLS